MTTPALPSQPSPSPLPAPTADTPPAGYGDFLAEVKTQIRQRQLQAAQGWGKAVVETLARDLQAEFPGRLPLSATSSGWKWTARTTSSTCCCSTAA